MNIYNVEKLSNDKAGYLFLDTSSLIAIVSYFENFVEAIRTFKENGVALLTIPSIAFEFSRTDNIEGYNRRAQFIKDYIDVYPIEKH